MSQRSVLACGLAVLALAGCATATPMGTDAIDSHYVTGGGTWSSGGGITAVVRVKERDGAALVCGAYAMDRQSTMSVELNRWVIEAAAVDLAGDRLVQNLSFMRQLPYSGNIAGQQANCVASGKPWKAAYADAPPSLRFARMAFLDDPTDDMNPVIFRPGPRDAILR